MKRPSARRLERKSLELEARLENGLDPAHATESRGPSRSRPASSASTSSTRGAPPFLRTGDPVGEYLAQQARPLAPAWPRRSARPASRTAGSTTRSNDLGLGRPAQAARPTLFRGLRRACDALGFGKVAESGQPAHVARDDAGIARELVPADGVGGGLGARATSQRESARRSRTPSQPSAAARDNGTAAAAPARHGRSAAAAKGADGTARPAARAGP